MYTNTIHTFARLALKKTSNLQQNPLSFFIGAMMAGAYVGVGIILIFNLASTISPEYQKLIMGCTFGIALTLVLFAGSELFTGHTMYMTFGWLKKQTNLGDLSKIWAVSWLGNLAGSVFLCLIFYLSGGLESLAGTDSLLHKIAVAKIDSTAVELLAKGALCNTLVCLALWSSARVDSDTAKCIVIFWCLLAFIASGFEHSVANMTLLTSALIADGGSQITITGLSFNLFWVSLGNIIGGAGFVAFGYWKANGH